MAYGSAVSTRSGGENISHFTGVRMRVVGSGSLRMTLYSFDEVESQVLVPFTLSSVTNRELFRLSNFNQQRAFLRLGTTEINERFKINRIIIFAKEIYKSYPGTD